LTACSNFVCKVATENDWGRLELRLTEWSGFNRKRLIVEAMAKLRSQVVMW